jgi:group I intron endonuclease
VGQKGEEMIGVYKITNTIDSKVYVGSTTVDFNKRWRNHRSELERNLHGNIHLQRAWNLYGAPAFTFDVLEVVLDEQDICIAEQKWIDRFYGDNCYNFLPLAIPHPSSSSNPFTRIRASKHTRIEMGKRALDTTILNRTRATWVSMWFTEIGVDHGGWLAVYQMTPFQIAKKYKVDISEVVSAANGEQR